MKTFMMRVSVCLFLLLTFFSLGCSAQIKGEFKLVTSVYDLSKDKYYALIATVDGKMYAMQAKDDKSGTKKRLFVENITDNPEFFGDDNLYKFSLGNIISNGRYRHCDNISPKTGGSIRYNSNDGAMTSENKGTTVIEKAYFFEKKDGVDGLVLEISKGTKPISTNKYLKYCNGNGGFTYAMLLYEYIETPSASDTQVGSIEIKTSEGYATYYNSKSFVLPSGLTAAIVKEADKQNGELSLDWKYNAGDVIPGATALLIHGDKGTYQLNAPAAEAESQKSKVSVLNVDTENLLQGSDVDSETKGTEEGVPYYFYKLSYLTDAESGDKVLGFYWGATSGASFTNKANHAYLALKQSASYQVKGFQLPSFSDVTGISVPLAPTIEKAISCNRQGIFSLDGVRLPMKDVQSLPAGIYIVNGQKCLKK